MSQLAELVAAIRAGSTFPWALRHGAPQEAFPRLYAAEQHADVLIRLLALCGDHPGDVIDKAFREPLDEEQPPLDHDGPAVSAQARVPRRSCRG